MQKNEIRNTLRFCKLLFEFKNMDSPITERAEFMRRFWRDLASRNSGDTVVCNYVHYIIGNEESAFKGFDGAIFKIEYIDGTTRFTSNLWHQGTIPPEFVHLFTNNVKSITRV